MPISASFEALPTRDEQVSIRLTGPQLDTLDAYAERHGLTRAQAVRQAIGVALIHEHDAAATA